MNISVAELTTLARNNPSIKVTVEGQTLSIGDYLEQEKKAKYRNVKVYLYSDGTHSEGKRIANHGKPICVFDSKKEFERYNALKHLQRAGKITELSRQVPFQITAGGKVGNEKIRPITYYADFVYIENGVKVVEDVKPYDRRTQKYRTTRVFANNWKLLKLQYPNYKFVLF